MTEALALDLSPDLGEPVVEIVIPVYNEEQDLGSSVRRLRTYLDLRFPFSALITIVDNASTDSTWEVALGLSDELDGIRIIHLDQKGRGRAIRAAWTTSRAQVMAYMDVDLSTDLDALLPLVAPLLSGHSHVAIGSRLARGARVVRGPKREVISRSYNLLLRAVLRNRFSDAQCGFKAVRRDTAEMLLPLVDDEHWFFDTELLILAERNDLRIHEVPVDWVDDPDSRVDIARTAMLDLKGVWRVARALSAGRGHVDRRGRGGPESQEELTRFVGVGLVSTVAYIVLFLFLRGQTGLLVANALSLGVCVIGNTTAHAWFTLSGTRRMQWQDAVAGGLLVFAVTLPCTMAALGVAEAFGVTSTTTQIVALLIGSALAALVRFVISRAWSFRDHLRARTT